MVGEAAMRVGLKAKDEDALWVAQANTSRGPAKSRVSTSGKRRMATLSVSLGEAGIKLVFVERFAPDEEWGCLVKSVAGCKSLVG
jgi:hypothetical protein